MNEKVLVEIPPNQTFPHMRLKLIDAVEAKDFLKEARSEPSHWFAGARLVPENELVRFGYKVDKMGNPVRDPSKQSLAKAKYDEAERDRKRYNEEDDDPTIGDVKEENKLLNRRLDSLESMLQRQEDQIRAEIRHELEQEMSDIKTVSDESQASAAPSKPTAAQAKSGKARQSSAKK